MHRTLAQALGTTHIISPINMKLKKCGIQSKDELLNLAFTRGCKHYGEPIAKNNPTFENVSDTELGIAFLSMSNEYDPRFIRIGAQLISREKDPNKIYRVALLEKCLPIIVKIAKDGQNVEPENSFWSKLLELCKTQRKEQINKSMLPHWSRFTKQTGITNPFKQKQTKVEWIR